MLFICSFLHKIFGDDTIIGALFSHLCYLCPGSSCSGEVAKNREGKSICRPFEWESKWFWRERDRICGEDARFQHTLFGWQGHKTGKSYILHMVNCGSICKFLFIQNACTIRLIKVTYSTYLFVFCYLISIYHKKSYTFGLLWDSWTIYLQQQQTTTKPFSPKQKTGLLEWQPYIPSIFNIQWTYSQPFLSSFWHLHLLLLPCISCGTVMTNMFVRMAIKVVTMFQGLYMPVWMGSKLLFHFLILTLLGYCHSCWNCALETLPGLSNHVAMQWGEGFQGDGATAPSGLSYYIYILDTHHCS